MSETEGLNNGIMEAGALGKVVIATNVGAAPEMIINGQTGFICERNVEALVERLKWCSQYIRTSKSMGCRLQKEIQANWSWDRCITRYEEMFEMILNR